MDAAELSDSPAVMIDFGSKVEAIRAQLDAFRAQRLRCFATSSFQTQSVPLLHLLSLYAPDIPIYFLNTGYLFPETLAFRDQLARDWGLTVRCLRSGVPRAQQRGTDGRFLFASDPDACCDLNKVAPLEPVLAAHDVWINGVRATQSSVRAAMKALQPTRQGVLRYHPLLDWDARMVHYYIEQNGLPRHPLEDAGYGSIGCQPCTRRLSAELDDRGGRWQGLGKTECGLHTTLGGGS